MRRLLAMVAVMILVQVTASGCRHVAGACDCDHAPAAGAPATINGAPASTTPAIKVPGAPADLPLTSPAPLPK